MDKDDSAKKLKLYYMELGDKVSFDSNSIWLRVPGGWVYGDMQGTTFIPFNNEFQPIPKENSDG